MSLKVSEKNNTQVNFIGNQYEHLLNLYSKYMIIFRHHFLKVIQNSPEGWVAVSCCKDIPNHRELIDHKVNVFI